MRIDDLRVERHVDPIGIDEPAPLFGWRLLTGGFDRAQSAYRIRVTDGADPCDEAAAAVWDSGRVEAARTYDVAYDGVALRPRTRYRWAVRVWDEHGEPTDWSAASFETALGDEQDWGASWIGAPDEDPELAAPSLDPTAFTGDIERIRWPGPGEPAAVCFWTTIRVSPADPVAAAALVAVGADDVRVAANGLDVELEGGVARDGDLLRAFGAGTCRLVVRTASSESGAAPTALVRLDLRLRSGSLIVTATDGRWRCTPGAIDDDSAAVLAEAVGPHGDPPWGRDPAGHRPSPYLRRDVDLPGPVRRARAYVTALGAYELRVNGRRVDERRLSPGWTDFATRVPYQVYDLTDALGPGRNTFAAVLADGWYAGHLADWGPFQYGDRRLLLLRAEIGLEDGSTIVVVSDGTWAAGEGAVRYADLQNGAVVDARAEPAGWDRPSFDDHAWRPVAVEYPRHGRLEAEVAPPIIVAEERDAVRVTRRADGAQVVDIGQNVVGWVRLRLRGEPGTRVFVRHAEMLDETDGSEPRLYTDSLRHARCTDEFVLAGDPHGEITEPSFTVHGFRYCEVIGYGPDLQPQDVTAVVVHANLEPSGTFECSDERLNRLHANIGWSQRGNFLAVPTDCPQRDERMGWTGDAQVFTPTAAFGFDVRGFLRKWLRDVRDAQFADGSVPHVAPDLFTKAGIAPSEAGGAAGWGDAIVLVPYELYRRYGDLRTAEENLDAIAAWLEFCRRHSTGMRRPDTGFGDWLAVTPTPRDLVGTAYFAHAARVASELAEATGRGELARRWRELARDVRVAFREGWVRGGGVVDSGTQAAYALALQFGLLDEHERDQAAARLAADVRSRHHHLTTGFLATPHLLSALSSNGHEAVAFELLMQDSYPSWLYQVVHGHATTVWERWDSWSHTRGFQDPSMTSFNHYAYGAVGDWMYRTLGGIELAGRPERLLVRPRPGGTVTWARASLRTVLGDVTTAWSITDGSFDLRLTVPVGATAEVRLPPEDEARVVGSGVHHFRVASHGQVRPPAFTSLDARTAGIEG